MLNPPRLLSCTGAKLSKSLASIFLLVLLLQHAQDRVLSTNNPHGLGLSLIGTANKCLDFLGTLVLHNAGLENWSGALKLQRLKTSYPNFPTSFPTY